MIKKLLRSKYKDSDIISKGTKVKLNIASIKRNKNYPNLTAKYTEWVELHKDDTFTVIYNKKQDNNPALVCLKEDTNRPRWLFWVGDLTVAE